MRRSLAKAILCSAICAGVYGSGFVCNISYAEDLIGNDKDGVVSIIGQDTDNKQPIYYENIYGKLAYDPNDTQTDKTANEGKVTIINVVADSSICIYGGLAMNNDVSTQKLGDAKANSNIIIIDKLQLNGETKKGEICGGVAVSGPNSNTGNVYANLNKVILSESSIITENVIGGYAFRGGASSKNAQANDNYVEIAKSDVLADIYGGNVSTYSAGNGNKDYSDNIRDAIAEVNNNIVVVKDTSTIGSENNPNSVYGSYIYYYSSGNTAEAKNNEVSLNSSTIYGDIHGTYIQSFQCSTGNENSNGTKTVLLAEGNKVSITDSDVFGEVIGAYARDENNSREGISFKTIENSVEISGTSNVTGNIYGADNYSKHSTGKAVACEVYGNSVSIDGDTKVINKKGAIYGGSGYAYGYKFGDGDGKAGDVSVTNNSIIINGDVEIEANVFGGYAKSQGGGKNDRNSSNNGVGNAGNATASDNTVIVSGGTIKGDVYGGYAESVAFAQGKEGYGKIGIIEAKNNIIILQNNADLSEASIYGSNLKNTDTEGNNLIIDNWSGTVGSVNNFNNIKFQNIEWENAGKILTLKNNEDDSLKDTAVDVEKSLTINNSDTKLHKGDYMYFVYHDNESVNLGTQKFNGDGENVFTSGVAVQGKGKVEVEGDGDVKYTITELETTDQSKNTTDYNSVAAAFLITGSDLVVDGLNSMEQDQLFGTKTFAIVEGVDKTFEVADDLKVNGWNGLYGVGDIKKTEDGALSYAAFFENGTANYRTYNTFMDEAFRGDGSIVYNGGGIAGRYKGDDGVYAEASIRAGLLKNQMKNVFRDGNGQTYGYKTESPYWVLHAGVGKIYDVGYNRDLDVYARYYHTYNDGDSFTVAGDHFDVDDIVSDRLRLGLRYNTNKFNKWKTYYGAAWEYEFNGDSKVHINGDALATESLKGSSCFAEIGFNYQRDKSSPWDFEGCVRGYAGHTKGFSGMLRATYSF